MQPPDLSQVKTALFDAVGTVLYADPPVAAVYHAAGRRFGSSASLAEIGRRFWIAFARQEALDAAENAGQSNEQGERHRWREVVANVFTELDPGHINPLFQSLWDHFAQARHWALFDDVAPTFTALRKQGLTVGLASNFDARLEAICQGHVPLAACRHVFVSSRLGWRKPCPEFFQAIAQRLGLEPREILLVGDSLEHDYRPALAAGWQALLLRRSSHPGDPTSRPAPQGDEAPAVISGLTDLIDRVGLGRALDTKSCS